MDCSALFISAIEDFINQSASFLYKELSGLYDISNTLAKLWYNTIVENMQS